MKRYGKVRVLALVVFAVAGMIVLGSQLVGWAYTACESPSLSTQFCIDTPTLGSCNKTTESECRAEYDAVKRNQFPKGTVTTPEGTTKEVEADCWAKEYCVWNSNQQFCQPGTVPSDWKKGDKTVTGDKPCPVEE